MPVANGESACLFAEALGPANLTRLSSTSATIAAGDESCYCEQSILGREGKARPGPSVSVDLYAVTLARWLGVSDGELDTILRDL